LFQKLWNSECSWWGAVAYIGMDLNNMSTLWFWMSFLQYRVHMLWGVTRSATSLQDIQSPFSNVSWELQVLVLVEACKDGQPRILAPCLRFASYWGLAYFLWCIPCYTSWELSAEMNASLAYICNSYSIGNREKYSRYIYIYKQCNVLSAPVSTSSREPRWRSYSTACLYVQVKRRPTHEFCGYRPTEETSLGRWPQAHIFARGHC
jgi:hypothetical protein